ncbi:MAG: glycosyltransferase family 4 protein [Thermotogae bacterium]|nr:glycosyltransferase family 4 protein [Thermotogota bacterium]
MRVLVINWQDWKHPLAGGAEVHLKEIFSRLANMGLEIHVLSCGFKGSKRYEIIEGIHIHRVASRPIFNFAVPFKLREMESRWRFDILIEDLNKLPFYTKLYSKSPRKLAILHHLFGKTIYEETNPIAATYVYFQERLIPYFYKDWPFVVVSESTKEELVRLGVPESNVKVIYNGIDTVFFHPREKYVQPTVLYINRFRRYKRPDLAVEIFARIKKRMPEVRFLMAGKGPYLEKVRSLSHKLNVEVDFLGFISEKEKSEVLARSWVVLNTSSKEGWGLVNMEAFASGTPVVGFKVPGMKDSVKDGYNGFLVEYGNVEEAAKKVMLILEDTELRTKLSRNARKFAESFTWDKAAQLTYEILSNL